MGIELSVDDTTIEFKKELTLPDSPERIEREKFYRFEMRGYIVFPVGKPIPLLVNGSTSPIASIEVTEQTNFLLGGLIHTKGEYFVRVCRQK